MRGQDCHQQQTKRASSRHSQETSCPNNHLGRQGCPQEKLGVRPENYRCSQIIWCSTAERTHRTGRIPADSQRTVRRPVPSQNHQHTPCSASVLSWFGGAEASPRSRRQGYWVHCPPCRQRG